MPLSLSDVKSILDLDDAAPLTGTEYMPISQDGATVKAPVARAGSSLYSPPLRLVFPAGTLQVGSRTTTRAPFGLTVRTVKMSATTPSTSGVVTVDILRNGVSILSTKLTMDVGETTSSTAAIAAVIDIPEIAEDDEISAVVVTPGVGVSELQVWLIGASADVPPPPPPPVSTVRIVEGFDGGSDDEEANEISTSFDSTVGADSLTHSALASVNGGTALRIYGTDQHLIRKELPTDTVRKRRHYTQVRATSTGTAWINYTWAGDGTTVAFRYGITANRQVTLQAGTAGSGTGLDSTTVPLEQLSWANFELTAIGAASARLALYTGPNVNNIGEVGAHDVLQIAITAPDFGDVGVGLCVALPSGGGTVITPDLISEAFTFSTNAQPLTGALLPSADVVGSGALTTSVGTFLAGETSGVKVNGAGSHYIRFVRPSHMQRFDRIRIKYDAPNSGTGAATAWFDSQRNSASSANAYQIGIGTDGKLKARLASNGIGDDAITMASALTPGTEYDIIVEAHAGGVLKLGYVAGATVDSNAAAALTENVTMVNPLTATAFGNLNAGQPAAPAATSTPANFTILRWATSTEDVPSPPNATGSAPVDILIDAWEEDAADMPANHEVVYEGGGGGGGTVTFDALNVPSNGVLWGASCAPVGSQGTTTAGIALYESFARRRPDVLHLFNNARDWNGLFTATEKSWLTPTGGTRALPFVNWKVRGVNRPAQGIHALTCAQVRDGANDANIIRWARNIETYPHKVFIGLQHEPETDNELSTPGNSANEYADMWRHVVTLAKANGASNVIWCWIVTGSSSNAGANGSTWNALWPGDDVVDWLCWDAYWSTTQKIDFYGDFLETTGGRSLIAENGSNVTGWTAIGGMYGWATTAKTIGVNSLRYQFDGGKPLALTEYGIWFDVLTDAQGESRLRSIITQITDAPRIKMLLYYNNAQDHDNHIDGRPLSSDAYGDIGALPFFNVGTANAR